MVIDINPKRVFRILVYIIAALGTINLGLALVKLHTGHARLWGTRRDVQRGC